MSTGLNCEYVEVEPGKWYYILERGSAPKNAWDWREYADGYGPFATFDAAHTHCRDNHANPGGYTQAPYQEGYEPDEVMRTLIAEAANRKPERRWY